MSRLVRTNVEALMTQRGWTITELADRSKLSRNGISMMMNKRREPGLDMIESLARGFGVKPFELLMPPEYRPLVGDFSRLAEGLSGLTPAQREGILSLALRAAQGPTAVP